MRHALLVSFDLIRPGEPDVALSNASLLSALRADPAYGRDFDVNHAGFNLLEGDPRDGVERVIAAISVDVLHSYDVVAIACYVWAELAVQDLIRFLRGSGYDGTIIVGGPQISYAGQHELPGLYPGVDVFITGYGERALRTAIVETRPESPRFLAEDVDLADVPSPYLEGGVPLVHGQARVRLESRRGCPYRCSFCAHRDLRRKTVHTHSLERVFTEVDFLATHGVRKVNFLDPVFNQGTEYLTLMQRMVDMEFKALVTFQSRFELIRGNDGERFLELARGLNSHLEFGLQTAIEIESQNIQRGNRRPAVEVAMRQLAEHGVSYEVSLLYGLPGQTVKSFAESIFFLRENGCDRITAFPLMLLRGTELFAQRDRWAFRERSHGEFGIPVVVESESFSERDWWQMKSLADELAPPERV